MCVHTTNTVEGAECVGRREEWKPCNYRTNALDPLVFAQLCTFLFNFKAPKTYSTLSTVYSRTKFYVQGF